MESIWTKTAGLPIHRDPLKRDLSVEAAVVGGGMAGILTAWLLQQAGIDVVVLEKACVGGGVTCNTTAKITSQHGLYYHRLIEAFGKQRAKEIAHANETAIDQFERIVSEQAIDCGFTRLPAYAYSTSDRKKILDETDAAKRLGIAAEFTTDVSLPFPVMGAVRFERQAQFHPLRFLYALANDLPVFEDTGVVDVKGHTLFTNRGRVTAKHIIYAVHYPFLQVPGFFFMRMHQERSYVIAIQPVPKLDGMYYGIDADGFSLREGQGCLLFGGQGHRTGENRAGGCYAALREAASRYWPGHREVAYWSAQDCMTLDGLPYIGRISASDPDLYAVTGFGKWGMTNAMVSANVICHEVTGRDYPAAELLSPLRFTPKSSAKTFIEDGMHSVRDLTKRFLAPPRGFASDLPNGHGGVVEYDGEKLGVYKDENGVLFVVSIQCPHLGCQLEWNPDEKSWDCPCHGSRFDRYGHRIDGPAMDDLFRPQ